MMAFVVSVGRALPCLCSLVLACFVTVLLVVRLPVCLDGYSLLSFFSLLSFLLMSRSLVVGYFVYPFDFPPYQSHSHVPFAFLVAVGFPVGLVHRGLLVSFRPSLPPIVHWVGIHRSNGLVRVTLVSGIDHL